MWAPRTPSMFDDYASSILDVSTGVFGEQAEYFPKSGGSQLIDGIFQKESEIINLQDGVEVSSFATTLGIKLSDLSVTPTEGDTVVVRSVTYRIIKAIEDGHGGAVLVLHLN